MLSFIHDFAIQCNVLHLLATWHLAERQESVKLNKGAPFNPTVFKPISTYGTQLWGTASTSNIEILEHFQSKALRMIVDAPRHVPNTVIRRDLQTPTVKEEIRRYSSQYSARLRAHSNGLTVNLIELPDNKTPAKWSAYRIVSVIVVFVVLVFDV
jgi:hypothetical protein